MATNEEIAAAKELLSQWGHDVVASLSLLADYDIKKVAHAACLLADAHCEQQPEKRFLNHHASDEEMQQQVEREWQERWKELVCNEDGSLNLEAVKSELHDYAVLLHNVPKVYTHVTCGKISKVMTDPDAVIGVADEEQNRIISEAIAEELELREDSKPVNQRLLDAAKKVSNWMDWWLSQNECDCEDLHRCGKSERRNELQEIRAAIEAADAEAKERELPLFVAGEQVHLVRVWEIALKWLTLYEKLRDALIRIGTPEALAAVEEAEAIARKWEA